MAQMEGNAERFLPSKQACTTSLRAGVNPSARRYHEQHRPLKPGASSPNQPPGHTSLPLTTIPAALQSHQSLFSLESSPHQSDHLTMVTLHPLSGLLLVAGLVQATQARPHPHPQDASFNRLVSPGRCIVSNDLFEGNYIGVEVNSCDALWKALRGKAIAVTDQDCEYGIAQFSTSDDLHFRVAAALDEANQVHGTQCTESPLG